MLKKGSRVTIPNNEKLIKIYKKNNCVTTSFFYTTKIKDEKGYYEINEHYLINAIGVELPPNTKVVIDDILSVEQKTMKSSNGTEYHNVVLAIRVRDVVKDYANQKTIQESDNNQSSYGETINTLSDYADFI